MWRVVVQKKSKNGEQEQQQTIHRNTHNIKFNIKLYINNDGQRQRGSKKHTEEKKNRKSRKYLRVNCLI